MLVLSTCSECKLWFVGCICLAFPAVPIPGSKEGEKINKAVSESGCAEVIYKLHSQSWFFPQVQHTVHAVMRYGVDVVM